MRNKDHHVVSLCSSALDCVALRVAQIVAKFVALRVADIHAKSVAQFIAPRFTVVEVNESI